ncbi:MAG: NAD-dependent epimerase/dehydratase family protein [Cyclobacteriaceae bacterium]
MNILVTGAAGNIGSELVTALIHSKECFVVAVDNFLTGSIKKLPPLDSKNFKFIKADVNTWSEISSIMTSYKFDYVFHYAAVVGVLRTLQNPVMVLNDVQGIKNILDLSKNTGVKRVFYSSSSEVYGEPVEFPQNEKTTPLNSRLPYAIVKNLGEAFLRTYHQEYGLNYTIFRFFNTYGPKQSEDFVISKFIKLSLANTDLPINGDGGQTRTFCYIKDNIEVTLKCLFEGKCLNDVMNVGNDQEIKIVDLASKIIHLLNSKSFIIHLPALEEGDMTRRMPDISKMKNILGRDLTTLDDGILLTVKAFQNNS